MWKINWLSQQSTVNIGVVYMLGVVVVLSCVFAIAGTSAINYCGAKMCGNTNAHTFCRYREGPSDKCVGYEKAKLTNVEKTRLLQRLNNHRHVAAGGGIRGLPPAGNMLKMRWVEELAREAQRWADQCRPPRIIEEHDACRDLYSVQVGQCVASVVAQEPVDRVEYMVDAWYIQSLLYKGNVTYYVPPQKGGKYYGDFAQTMWAKSYMVGCARSRFKTPRHGRLLNVERLVCNIAPYGPQPTLPLWLPDAPTDSCPTRSMPSLVWTSLCDYQRKKQNEIVSLDSSMTLEDHLVLNTVLEIEQNKTLNYLGSLDKLYLAKVAKAAIANMYTTQSYLDSMQNSEIMDLVNAIAVLTNDTTIAFGPQVITKKPRLKKNTSLNIASTMVTLQTETTTKMTKAKRRKHKLNMIEGPGVYKMEDFTDFFQMTENIKGIEKISGEKKNYYTENVLIEMTKNKVPNYTEHPRDKFKTVQLCQNRNEGACVAVQTSTGVSKVRSTEHYDFTVPPEQLLEDVTNERHLTSRRHFGVFDIQMYGLMNDESFSGSGDDYSETIENSTTSTTTEDPETVRELQEALARMERDMEPYDPSGKTRRDLGLKEMEATSREYAETPSNDSDSADAILNILKLIPSWTAPTESPDIASRVTPSLVIVLALRTL